MTNYFVLMLFRNKPSSRRREADVSYSVEMSVGFLDKEAAQQHQRNVQQTNNDGRLYFSTIVIRPIVTGD